MSDGPSPADAWATLSAGNERFALGRMLHPRQDTGRREELAGGQQPIAAVLGCSDSRVSPEIVFDLGLGDAFVIRTAGQVVDTNALGSIEYAVIELKVPVLVVLSHDSCGAVRAAIDSQRSDADPLPVHIADLIAPIGPAVRLVAEAGDGASFDPATFDPSAIEASAVGREHLRASVADVLKRSEIVSAAVADGSLAIVGANYRLLDGTIEPDSLIGVA